MYNEEVACTAVKTMCACPATCGDSCRDITYDNSLKKKSPHDKPNKVNVMLIKTTKPTVVQFVWNEGMVCACAGRWRRCVEVARRQHLRQGKHAFESGECTHGNTSGSTSCSQADPANKGLQAEQSKANMVFDTFLRSVETRHIEAVEAGAKNQRYD